MSDILKDHQPQPYVFGRKGISYNMYINEGIIKGRTIVLEAKIVVPEP
jgi:hypothetical protein